jgi:hypothetical protein
MSNWTRGIWAGNVEEQEFWTEQNGNMSLGKTRPNIKGCTTK